MFNGTLDVDGNYRSANRFGGRTKSSEEAYSISVTADKQINVLRSNSDLLHLGDETYFSVTGKYYLVIGVVGCLPISIDNEIVRPDKQGNIWIESGKYNVKYSEL